MCVVKLRREKEIQTQQERLQEEKDRQIAIFEAKQKQRELVRPVTLCLYGGGGSSCLKDFVLWFM